MKHEHDFKLGKSGTVYVCSCGQFRGTGTPIVEIKAKPKLGEGSTTGPWQNQVEATENYLRPEGHSYDDPLGAWICEVRTSLGETVALATGNGKPIAQDRARLIAKAPLLVEARELLQAAYVVVTPGCALESRIRALLAKLEEE